MVALPGSVDTPSPCGDVEMSGSSDEIKVLLLDISEHSSRSIREQIASSLRKYGMTRAPPSASELTSGEPFPVASVEDHLDHNEFVTSSS